MKTIETSSEFLNLVGILCFTKLEDEIGDGGVKYPIPLLTGFSPSPIAMWVF
jgi:hypothetical protein